MSSALPEHRLTDDCVVIDIPSDAVLLETAELSLALGYPTAEPPANMAGLISSTADDIREWCDFAAGYVMHPLRLDESRPDGLILGTRFLQTRRIIRNQLKGAEKAALLICTIGYEPELRIKQLLADGEPAQAFIADTVASILVEKVADAVHRHLEVKFKATGLGVTNRFSPGYCGWDVKEQHHLFRLLPNGFCGVSLEGSAFMQPRKSISAMIGMGKSLERTDYPCIQCDDQECLYRGTNDAI